MRYRGGMAKTQPLSIRLSPDLDRAVTAEARRLKRSKGAIVEALAEEALRMRQFPGIGYRGDDAAREPWVIGTGLDVWELCQMIEEYESIEELVDAMPVTERQIRLALAYRERYPEEIEAAIAENRRRPEEWLELYPFIEPPLALQKP
jgi:uncharacterized protein (DUF433 family)